eukprot:12513574-Heterocapsa_arctica.AAC.1
MVLCFGLPPRSWRTTGKSCWWRSSCMVGRFRCLRGAEALQGGRAGGGHANGLALRSASKELEGDRDF